MPEYLVICDVEGASGTQTWAVTAENEEDAVAKYKAGECEFVEEDIEVTSLGEPEVELNE